MLGRIGFIVSVCVASLLFFPSSAFAHAQVTSSNPRNGEELQESPDRVSITFNEDVHAVPGSMRVYDAQGDRISMKAATSHGRILSARVPYLSSGTYAVVWSAVSADSHPVHGTIVFSVGEKIDADIINSDEFSRILNAGDNSATRLGFLVSQFFIFLGAALLVGAVIFRIRGIPVRAGIVSSAAFICAVASAVGLIFYTARAQSLSFGDVLSKENFISTRMMYFSSARVALCALCVGIFRFRQKWAQGLLVVASAVLVSTFTLSGHAVAGKYVALAIPADFIHVAAALIWAGGIGILLIGSRSDDWRRHLRSFSPVALWCVIAVILSGIFAWWRQVGSLQAMKHTWFGNLVSYKTAALIIIVVCAYFIRGWLRHSHEKSHESKKKPQRILLCEGIIVSLVFALTAVLIASVPGRDAYSQPVSQHLAVSIGYFDLTVDPAEVGPSEIHLYVTRENGTPYPVNDFKPSLTNNIATLTLTDPKQDGRVDIPMKFQGLNHFISAGARIPYAGRWNVTIRIRASEFDEIVATSTITVKP